MEVALGERKVGLVSWSSIRSREMSRERGNRESSWEESWVGDSGGRRGERSRGGVSISSSRSRWGVRERVGAGGSLLEVRAGERVIVE